MKALAAVALALVSTAASAQFVALLKNSPAELFDDMDLRIFLDTARRALDEGAENQAMAWKNPDTGHGGDMTVLKRFESKRADPANSRPRDRRDAYIPLNSPA